MPRTPPPGSRARALGAKLRAMREETGKSLRTVATDLGWPASRLSRLERGVQNVMTEDITAILGVLGMPDDRWEDDLSSVEQHQAPPGWWEGNLGMTKESARLADYEDQAEEIINWSPLTIPGLLQTADYAFALLSGINVISSQDVALRLGARMQRQAALRGKRYTAFVGESALRSIVGDRRVMIAQLASLRGRDDVTIRVVPTTAGGHLGQAGPFMLLRFEDAPTTVVHVELLSSGVFLDRDALTGPYDAAIDQVSALALGESESDHAIAEIQHEMEG